MDHEVYIIYRSKINDNSTKDNKGVNTTILL